MTPSKIRSALRTRRRSLSPQQQCQCAERIATRICNQIFFLRAKRVGLYLPNDGEADSSLIMDICLQSGKKCFLPALHPKENRLHFVAYDQHTSLVANSYGIPEPSLRGAKLASAWSLDLILMPLVGFDRQGNRLGMGGGYYDRTLAFVNAGRLPVPRLVGLAHSCQEVASIPSNNWDVAVEKIITDREIICAKPK